METYLTQITDYLLTQSWQIALLVAAVAVATLLLKNRSAHVRYLLWLIVLAKCLVPPLLTVPLAVLPDERVSALAAMPEDRMSSLFARPEMRMAETPVAPAPSAAEPVTILEETLPQFSVRQWAGLGWIVGATLFVLVAVTKALRTEFWLRRQRKLLSAKLQSEIEDLFCELGVRTLPKVWLVEGIGQPFVWGLVRGGIYLPANFVKAHNAGHRRGVIGHELSHILRFDAAVNLLQVMAQAVFWFHPFVWWANRRIRAEREKCCDEMTIARFSAKAQDYSDAIVNIVVSESESTRPVPSLAVAGPVKNIEERIRTMLRPGRKFHKRPSLTAVTVVLLLALLTVPTALVLTTEAQEKTTAAPLPAPAAKDKAIATAALFRAIRDKNVEQMRLAIEQGADLEAKNKYSIWLKGDIQSLGCTPLYVAAGVPADRDVINGSIRLLLEAGANPNTRAPNGQIPLHFAAYQGGISSVEMLVSAGSDVNAADKEGRTPAIVAFELGRYNTFDLMVRSGATVSTDLMSAYKGNLSRVRSLIKNGKAQERLEQDLTLLHAAAAGGHTAIVELLLTNGLDVHSETQEGYTALHYAVAGNHREVAELLLAKGADVNTEPGKQTPLHWAIGRQHKEMIEWLVAKGANPNVDGGDYWGTPLHWAVWWWDVDTALLLVSHGGDIHLRTQKYPYSPLFDSVIEGHPTMAEALVTKTGDTKAAKWAPLLATVTSGDLQAIEDMLTKGADVNAKSDRGLSALHWAAVLGHKDIAKLLIEKGADVNAKAESSRWDEGMTALHGSCVRGRKEVAELLIARGADVNVKTKNGYTPLHIAATEGYRDVAELLIAKGADMNAKDDYGRCPLTLAKNRNCEQVIELLREHGAKEDSASEEKNRRPTKPLHQATEDGDLEQVKKLIDGATAALFRAIRDANVEKMRLAINQGADLEGKNKDTIFLIADMQSIGCTPLYAAAGVPESNDDMIGLLLEAGANPNTRGSDGEIPLHAAARSWRLSMVELLVSAGSDVNAADREGRIPAIIAFELGHYDMFDLMVGSGATVSTDLMSAYKGNLSRVQSLIENGEAQERLEQGLTLLHAAAAGGHTAIVELLLATGLDGRSKTQEGYTALHYAAAGNHREVAELLLAKGADVNTEPGKETALHWAVREQHKEMVEWLLARRANPNADAFGSPLHWAVWWGDVDTALLLVSHGSDIHLVTQSYPFSPLFDSVKGGDRAMADALVTKTGDTKAAKWARLHAAVVSGNRQATERLFARGTDVNAKGERGFLALHLAAGLGRKDIVELLIEKGADVNASAASTLWDEDMTVLHGACLHGRKGVAELLIAKGADVDAKSRNGYTPLHVAVTRGYRDVAELIAKGADINAKNSYGRTALSLAKEHGCDEVVELLRKHGAKE